MKKAEVFVEYCGFFNEKGFKATCPHAKWKRICVEKDPAGNTYEDSATCTHCNPERILPDDSWQVDIPCWCPLPYK